MLSLLATKGRQSANDLHAPFDVAQPTISKHLKVLEQAGLVRREVEGRTHLFELELAAMNDAQDWLARHKAFWEGTLHSLDAFVTRAHDEANDK